MHPGGKLLAEGRIGELDVVGVDHELGDGVLDRLVVGEMQGDAEGTRGVLDQRLHMGGDGGLGIRPPHGAARGNRVQHRVIDRARRGRGAQPDPRNHAGRVLLRQGRELGGEAKGRGGGEQRLGRRRAGDGQLAVIGIDHLESAAHIGDHIDVIVAEHEAPGLGVMTGWRENRVTNEKS